MTADEKISEKLRNVLIEVASTKEFLIKFMEAAPDVFAILDQGLCIVDLNSTGLQLLGAAKEAVASKNLSEIFLSCRSRTHMWMRP